jgi:hypothetical protein
MKTDPSSTPAPRPAAAGVPAPATPPPSTPAIHRPEFPHAPNKPAFHAFDATVRYSRLQPRRFVDSANSARVARAHTRGRHFG